MPKSGIFTAILAYNYYTVFVAIMTFGLFTFFNVPGADDPMATAFAVYLVCQIGFVIFFRVNRASFGPSIPQEP